MKPSVDNLAPRNFVHIKQNLRKQRVCTCFVLSYAFPLLSLHFLKVEEDRLGLIDHHNRELLSRMHHIMHTTGRVDHRNQDWRPKKRCVCAGVCVEWPTVRNVYCLHVPQPQLHQETAGD